MNRGGVSDIELGRDPDEEHRDALAREQLSLDDALTRVEEHGNDAWFDFAWHVVQEVARTNGTFIVDAVWDAGLGKPPEARAIGVVILRAVRERLIEPTDEYRPSAQPGCHKVPRRVWRSLIFEVSP